MFDSDGEFRLMPGRENLFLETSRWEGECLPVRLQAARYKVYHCAPNIMVD